MTTHEFFSTDNPIDETVEAASTNVEARKELVGCLGHESRAVREYVSQVLAEIARTDPENLHDHSDEIIDALNRPEPLTRYCMIEVIGEIAQTQPKLVQVAYELLQECLYDEDSGTVRLYAFRVLARYGATGPARSIKVWPDLSMALRSFRGDGEFMGMMNELIGMLGGRAAPEVKEAAVELFAFDAGHSKGEMKKKAEAVAAFAPEVLDRINKENEEKAAAASAAKEAAKAAAEEKDEEE